MGHNYLHFLGPYIVKSKATYVQGPGGVLEVYMMGGPTYFFGLKIYTLGIFLGQGIGNVFF